MQFNTKKSADNFNSFLAAQGLGSMNPSFAARFKQGVEISPMDDILLMNGYDMDALFKNIIPEPPPSVPILNMSDEKVAEMLTARLQAIGVNDPGQLIARLQAAGVSDQGQLRKAILSVYPSAKVDNSVPASKIVGQWYWDQQQSGVQDVDKPFFMEMSTATWSDLIQVNRVGRTSDAGGKLFARQPDQKNPKAASVLSGGTGNDVFRGFTGWDFLSGGAGNDFIRAGNGRDIIAGGPGVDELHGDFGWNTYRDERDGSPDLIAIKSDQYLYNWIYGKSGNNPNGEKADIIEGLDPVDRIRIIGVTTEEVTFVSGVSHKGITGIGIYGKGALEAIYIGGDLSVQQLTNMTSGDASVAAMNDQIESYGWIANPGVFSPQLIG